MNAEITDIRDKYIFNSTEIKKLFIEKQKFAKLLQSILENETDINKRKEIIDFVYADNVEELHEYTMRKIYLENKQ